MPVQQVTLGEKFKMLFRNKAYVFLIVAAFFRFSAGYSLGFSGATFFLHRYPDYTREYSIVNALTIIVAGLSAAITGGFLSDKLQSQLPTIYGLIAGVGALLAIPLVAVTFLV